MMDLYYPLSKGATTYFADSNALKVGFFYDKNSYFLRMYSYPTLNQNTLNIFDFFVPQLFCILHAWGFYPLLFTFYVTFKVFKILICIRLNAGKPGGQSEGVQTYQISRYWQKKWKLFDNKNVTPFV